MTLRRRTFITGLGAAAAWPMAARAQQPKVPAIGGLSVVNSWDGLRASLRDIGYVEGSNIRFDLRSADGKLTLLRGHERAIDDFAHEPGSGLIVAPGNIAQQYHAQIVRLADRYRLPAIYYDRLFADAGGLMSYGVDLMDVFRRGATYVDRILRGTKPGDLPVQAPTKYELVVNLKAAKSLGLALPHEFLLIADEVIE